MKKCPAATRVVSPWCRPPFAPGAGQEATTPLPPPPAARAQVFPAADYAPAGAAFQRRQPPPGHQSVRETSFCRHSARAQQPQVRGCAAASGPQTIHWGRWFWFGPSGSGYRGPPPGRFRSCLQSRCRPGVPRRGVIQARLRHLVHAVRNGYPGIRVEGIFVSPLPERCPESLCENPQGADRKDGVGRTMCPSEAMPPMMRASCRGVAATAPWPMPTEMVSPAYHLRW